METTLEMTPLERAARALGELYDGSADPVDTPNNWARAQEGVRAVLQAFREPSEGMLRAGFEDYPTIWTAAVTTEDRVGIWQAMIDTALEESR